LQKERALHDCLLSLIKNRLIRSAHDISEGGIALAIAECCIIGNIGAEVKAESNLNAYEFLYSESQSRALVSLRPENEEQFLEQCSRFSMSAHRFGTVGGSRISIAGLFEVELKEAAEAWHMTLPKKMEV
jgi:phosphoribosylformylglycinamidine synthase